MEHGEATEGQQCTDENTNTRGSYEVPGADYSKVVTRSQRRAKVCKDQPSACLNATMFVNNRFCENNEAIYVIGELIALVPMLNGAEELKQTLGVWSTGRRDGTSRGTTLSMRWRCARRVRRIGYSQETISWCWPSVVV